ncbi:alpha-1,2-mannosyltransferase KRE2 NDAI_0C05280 [Naumovozyma dairenensis CBS 421]|uniref:Glycosyltransferase family 15 protein n=1 Tax=Naumovozyma dairenensis (strain ATCC 10597 / BCRC 20456 / CBS 421 / NBRC 0211 / NRRL Y-12639) TaxID=1071378 RepID=G0W8S6_NAUDC|nr:hypothetical protein NDAI_0C05280 [Naumovozyma dairenensis CBS 421]CCD24187.1 hypothetical protein NDAI_0C05280 [Naumovozyma dairenensis CBS 421]
MAIFVTKRLLRFITLLVVSLLILLSLSAHDSTSSYLPASLDFSSYRNTEPQQQQQQQQVQENVGNLLKQNDEDGTLASTVAGPDKDEENKKNALHPAASLEEKTSTKNLKNVPDIKDSLSKDIVEFMAPSFENKGKRPKATFVSLVRNSELNPMLDAIKSVQKKFNNQFNYDWVFLNDDDFTDEFKSKIKETIPNSTIKFGKIPKEHWSYPDYISTDKAAETREKMKKIIYGSSESYRHMCRYQSGFFWRHPIMEDYDWYWRVEPSTKLYCDIKYDVFQWMQDNDKAYGFTITIHEYLSTIPTLWDTSKKFFEKHPDYLRKDNLMKFISDDGGKSYNLCHFWSNFEVANLNLWRSPAYTEYFDYLDHAGGFFYERWGDAPVHSIAVSAFLPKDRIHYFSDIGYHHPPYDNCPLDNKVFKDNNCECDQKHDFTWKGYACGRQYYDAAGITRPSYWEKYS